MDAISTECLCKERNGIDRNKLLIGLRLVRYILNFQ